MGHNCKPNCPNKHHGEIYISCDRIEEVSPTYIIEGSPLSLKRPRFFARRVYDSQKAEKLHRGLLLKKQHDERPPYNGILHFDLTFYFVYSSN